MGKWRFEGFTREGKKQTGELMASSEREVRRMLRARGIRTKVLTPPSLLEFDIGEWMVEKGLARPFGTKELTRFTRNLAIMLSAGVALIQALEILFKSQKNATLKRAIKSIARDVSEGKTISEAMEAQNGFNRLYCNLVKAGEAGGILDSVLQKLAEHMEQQEKIRSKVKNAMSYPGIVTVVGFGIVWLMMVFVVPQFVGMLKDTGQEPPWITQLVINISAFLGDYILITFIAAVAGIAFLISYIRTPTGKVSFDVLVLKMPLLGEIVIKGNLSSFSKTLATMLQAGVSLVESLDVCIETVDNKVISDDLVIVRKRIVEGGALTDALARISYFPDMVAQMIKVGEQTGRIDQMLDKVADIFENEVAGLLENMTKMIEPLIIVVLGVIIAGILVAMYLPVFMSAGGAG